MSTATHPLYADHFQAAWTDELIESVERNDNADTSYYMTSGKTKERPQGEDSDWWLDAGPKMVNRWHDFRLERGWPIWVMPDGSPAIELDILVEVDGYPLKAIIDRVFNVEGAPVIVDLKTGKREPEDLLQLGFYRVALLAKYGLKVGFGAYWMARTGKLTTIHDISKYTPELLVHYIKQYEAGTKAGVFLPHISALCRACSQRTFCHAFGGRSAEVDPDAERSQPWVLTMGGSRSN